MRQQSVIVALCLSILLPCAVKLLQDSGALLPKAVSKMLQFGAHKKQSDMNDKKYQTCLIS